jgi:hypothetical protein
VDDVDAFKRLKVPEDIRGCHTAVVHGYYLGAHVPLQAAERLLKQRPALAGLAVAGMPKGSLGMEPPQRLHMISWQCRAMDQIPMFLCR